MTLIKNHINQTSLEDLLTKAPQLRLQNEETYGWFSRELLKRSRQYLDKENAASLLYLADLCRKGQTEDLNTNPHAASFYFSKAVLYSGAGQESDPAAGWHQVVHHLYQVQHVTASGVPVSEQLGLLNDLIHQTISLQQQTGDTFFCRLRVFLWLEHQKKLVRSGDPSSALEAMEELLKQTLQLSGSPELAAGLPFEREYTIYAVYNILFVFSVLSPAYKVQFNDLRKELAAMDRSTAPADPFISAYLDAEQALVADDSVALEEAVCSMVTNYDQQRQSSMVASGFASLPDEVTDTLRQPFRGFIQEAIPSYILDRIFPVLVHQPA